MGFEILTHQGHNPPHLPAPQAVRIDSDPHLVDSKLTGGG